MNALECDVRTYWQACHDGWYGDERARGNVCDTLNALAATAPDPKLRQASLNTLAAMKRRLGLLALVPAALQPAAAEGSRLMLRLLRKMRRRGFRLWLWRVRLP